MTKFPYKGFSEKELTRMESSYFCLIMGGDFVIENEIITFTQKEISKIYNSTLRDLLILTQDGSARDSKYAIDLIGSLRIIPFRVH